VQNLTPRRVARVPMGLAIPRGLVTSTLLTSIVVPVNMLISLRFAGADHAYKAPAPSALDRSRIQPLLSLIAQ
jgi:hypothetical protein